MAKKQNRISIGGGRWFNPDAAKEYEEATWWNGNNHVSKATGSQWDHEKLYLTPKGTYVLHAWSQWQGAGESYEVISASQAHEWLMDNGHHDALDKSVVAQAEV